MQIMRPRRPAEPVNPLTLNDLQIVARVLGFESAGAHIDSLLHLAASRPDDIPAGGRPASTHMALTDSAKWSQPRESSGRPRNRGPADRHKRSPAAV